MKIKNISMAVIYYFTAILIIISDTEKVAASRPFRRGGLFISVTVIYLVTVTFTLFLLF